jgi:hypothetical protein
MDEERRTQRRILTAGGADLVDDETLGVDEVHLLPQLIDEVRDREGRVHADRLHVLVVQEDANEVLRLW